MNNHDRRDIPFVLARVSAVALYIVLGTGILAIAAGYLIIEAGISVYPQNTLIRNILFLVGLTDLAATQFIKRTLLIKLRSADSQDRVSYQMLLGPTMIIAAMCSAISFYGLVAVILGSPLDVLLLFVVVSLIGFQLFRIREKDLGSSAN